ncbi:hypothetical protein [Streptomyces sp. PTY087I2]|uniref:hypothetical protein n=1 Tax=Streptomyces sp. PTY087I2 TaxID=1819298 RepID=UPI000B07ED01|nr:hypothetical protein [Streptomyces sp. PTY087I2]
MAINLGAEGGKGFNPVTGLMEAMSRHPAAAAEFFNENLRSDTNDDGIVTSPWSSRSRSANRPNSRST